jgi:putative Mg2+ transporter-C (MgtC) family protein
VSLGAALFTVGGAQVLHADPTRVAAQIASGVGFLGAGAILRDRGRIRGLTTAASLWVTASLGMAAGFGEWQAGVTVAGVAVVVLTLLKRVERTFFPQRRGHEVSLTLPGGTTVRSAVDRVTAAVGHFDVREVGSDEQGHQRVTGIVHLPREVPLIDLVEQLQQVGDVSALDVRG